MAGFDFFFSFQFPILRSNVLVINREGTIITLLCFVDVTLINVHSAQVFVNICHFDMFRPEYFIQRKFVTFFSLL